MTALRERIEALPGAAAVVAVVGLGLAFHRWRGRSRRPSAEDRTLVEEALERNR